MIFKKDFTSVNLLIVLPLFKSQMKTPFREVPAAMQFKSASKIRIKEKKQKKRFKQINAGGIIFQNRKLLLAIYLKI